MELSADGISLNKVIRLEINTAEDSKLDCLESLVAYVHRISDTYPSPFTLFVSGGIDSQAMLYVWKLSGVPFNAVHIRYDGFNDHDIDECKQFCEREQIELAYLDFDIVDFLENRLDYYATAYQCASPQLCTHMAFSELVKEGTKIFSGNIPYPGKLAIDNTIFGLQRYATISKSSIIPFFLMSDASVAKASVLRLKANDDKLDPFTSATYLFKCDWYKVLGIPVIPQSNKLTGFERLKDYYDAFGDRVTPKMKLAHSSLPSKRVFDQLFRNKYLIKFKNHYTPIFLINQK